MKFQFLSVNNLSPKGWLKNQLELQATGLHGNLDKIWPDVKQSKWIGGDKEGWERMPYFLDGFIPLAYLVNDQDMISRAKKYIDCILNSQLEDGCFYPAGDKNNFNRDIWSLFLLLKVLVVYHDCSNDNRIEGAVYNALKFLDKYIDAFTPYNWAGARWFECVIPINWLYQRKKENWLIILAKRLKCFGFDYQLLYPEWKRIKPIWALDSHVVNIAMALKSEAVYCNLMGTKPKGLAEKMLKVLFRYHGTAYGHFTGDECLSGNSPSQGSELCGIVEAMYSYEWLFAITGESKWGDYLENLAFNGLPATISEDMWAHQYDQQVNQIACIDFLNPIFRTNRGDANLFGLEPNFGCCTSNFGQGWPKFALSSYMQEDDSLVILSPVPMQINFNGNIVTVNSEYPFRKVFEISAQKDVKIKLRIPSWLNLENLSEYKIEKGFALINLKASEKVTFKYDMKPLLVDRFSGRKCLKYGPLLFALPIESKCEKLEYVKDGVERKFPYCDYTFTPISAWNYAFCGDSFSVEELPYKNAFSRANPPIKIKADFFPVKWGYEKGHQLVASKNAGNKIVGERQSLFMQPYGATYLRITEMNKVNPSSK